MRSTVRDRAPTASFIAIGRVRQELSPPINTPVRTGSDDSINENVGHCKPQQSDAGDKSQNLCRSQPPSVAHSGRSDEADGRTQSQ